MSSELAQILNELGIPWPNADTDKIREAGQRWSKLADAIEDAMYLADGQAKALMAGNSGAAINQFEQYWKGYADPTTGILPKLVETCRNLAERCTEYATAVDEAKHKLEEDAVGAGVAVGGGGLLTLASGGISDLAAEWAESGLDALGASYIELLGVQVSQIVGRMVAGGVASAFGSLMGSEAKSNLATIVGDKSGEQKTLAMAEGAGVAFALGLGTSFAASSSIAAASKAADGSLGSMPDMFIKDLPAVSYTVASIPGALKTPAGQALTNMAADYAAGKLSGQEGPNPSTILGEALNARLEATINAQPDAPDEKK